MDEERILILRMVAEKKIAADDAARLLDALMEGQETATAEDKTSEGKREQDRYHYNYQYKHDSSHDRTEQRRDRHRAREEHQRERQRRRASRHGHRQGQWQEKFGEVTHMFEDMFGEGGLFGKYGVFTDFCGAGKVEQTVSISEGSEVHISCTGGKLTVQGTDEDQMRIRVEDDRGSRFPGPQVHQDTEEKRVDITSIMKDIIVEAPWQMTGLFTSVSGGNLLLKDVSSDVHLVLNGGNLEAHDVTGHISSRVSGGKADLTVIHSSNIDIHVTGGPVTLSMDAITEGSVAMNTIGGDARLILPETSTFEVDAQAVHGHIRTNLKDEQDIDKGGDFGGVGQSFHTTHNGGGAMVSITTQAGDIDIEVADTAATERLNDKEE